MEQHDRSDSIDDDNEDEERAENDVVLQQMEREGRERMEALQGMKLIRTRY